MALAVYLNFPELEGHDILPWLQEFFGEEPERYAIIVGMQQGYGNYGLSSTSEDGSVEYISIVGANSPSIFRKVPSFSHWWFIPTVVHEFAHSFVNPAVYENETTLEDVAVELFPYHQEKMMEQGYSSWQHMAFEYLVRASVNRYLLEHENGKGYRRRIRADESQGFPGITLLTDCLGEYEENRDRYPTLEAFMPKVAGCFEELLRSLRDEEDYGAQTVTRAVAEDRSLKVGAPPGRSSHSSVVPVQTFASGGGGVATALKRLSVRRNRGGSMGLPAPRSPPPFLHALKFASRPSDPKSPISSLTRA